MTAACVALLVYGVTAVGVSCFFLGRMTAAPSPKKPEIGELPLSEKDKKTLRELQNFLQYDGFSQP